MGLMHKQFRKRFFILSIFTFLLMFSSCSVMRKKNCIPCPQWGYEQELPPAFPGHYYAS
jgi:hypothetical protein